MRKKGEGKERALRDREREALRDRERERDTTTMI